MNKTQKTSGGLILFLLASHGLFTMFPYLGCAAVLLDVMADLAIPAEAAAFVITIITAVSGVCMFLGGSIIDWLGYVKAFGCSVVLAVVGTIITAVAPNFAVFMIGRAVFAAGFGLNCSIIPALASMWFPGAAYAKFNTYQLLGSSVGGALAYIVISPLIALTGSWRGAYWVFALILAIYCVLCFLFVKYPDGVAEGLAQQKAALMPQKQLP